MVVIIVAACAFVDAAARQAKVDADGDGVLSVHVGGDDCDDGNTKIGAKTKIYADEDGDGYGSGEARLGCTGAAVDGDCDDGDAAIHPAAVESCGGSVDVDCDGNVGLCSIEDFGPSILGPMEGGRAGSAIASIDEDSAFRNAVLFGAPGTEGGSATIYVGTDAPDTGFLHGEDGYFFAENYAESEFGSAVMLADLNGDGSADLVGGAPGRPNDDGTQGAIGIDYGAFEHSGNALRDMIAEAARDEFGASVAAADFDEGERAVVAGAPGAAADCGAVYVFRGRGRDEVDAFTAFQLGGSKLFGDCIESPNNRLGATLAVADLNGDGEDEIIIGAPGDASRPTDERPGGAIWIVPSRSLESEMPLVERLADGSVVRWASEDANAAAGTAIAVGDFGLDGTVDIAVGAPGASPIAIGGGLVYLLFHPMTDDLDGDGNLVDAGARIEGDKDHAALGSSLATIPGPNDGDYAMLAIGAPAEDDETFGTNAGAAYVFRVTEEFNSPPASDADFRFACSLEDCAGGTALGAGDFDGDGVFDLYIGAPGGYDPSGVVPAKPPGAVTVALGIAWSG